MGVLKLDEVPADFPPAGPEGDWEVAMSMYGSVYLATDLTSLMQVLIEHYPASGSDDEKLLSRSRAAVRFASTAQGVRVAEKSSLGAFEPVGMSPDEVAVAYEDKASAVDPAGRWKSPVPLLVLASHYEPYTSLPAPGGNVVAIDPFTELTLLESLAEAGLIELFEVGESEGPLAA